MRYVMLSVLFACSVSTAAFGQTPPPPPPQFAPYTPSPPTPPLPMEDGPGNGVQIELGVFGGGGVFNFIDSALSVASSFGSTSGVSGLLDLEPNLLVGYQWVQNALLLGLDLNAVGGTGGSGPSLVFGIGPTYRRYFTPLRTGAFSGFGEGSIGFLILAPPSGPSSYGVSVSGGIGGEWLFVKNFGLFLKASLGYEHFSFAEGTSTGLGGSTSDTLNLDGIGLAGEIGVTAHL